MELSFFAGRNFVGNKVVVRRPPICIFIAFLAPHHKGDFLGSFHTESESAKECVKKPPFFPWQAIKQFIWGSVLGGRRRKRMGREKEKTTASLIFFPGKACEFVLGIFFRERNCEGNRACVRPI